VQPGEQGPRPKEITGPKLFVYFFKQRWVSDEFFQNWTLKAEQVKVRHRPELRRAGARDGDRRAPPTLVATIVTGLACASEEGFVYTAGYSGLRRQRRKCSITSREEEEGKQTAWSYRKGIIGTSLRGPTCQVPQMCP
jgi:hypothetical protein